MNTAARVDLEGLGSDGSRQDIFICYRLEKSDGEDFDTDFEKASTMIMLWTTTRRPS